MNPEIEFGVDKYLLQKEREFRCRDFAARYIEPRTFEGTFIGSHDASNPSKQI
jgi:hypothetical protein